MEADMGSPDTTGNVAGLQGDVVLALCSEGRDELREPQAGLSLPQRKLLSRIDGKRTLRQIASAEATLRGDRLARDAALLLGLGLVEIEHGLLQPITRPSTSPPATVDSALDAAARRRRHASAATRRRRRAVGERRPGWGRALPAFVAGGVLVGLAVHWMQPAPPAPTIQYMTPRPISTAPTASGPSPAAASEPQQLPRQSRL
jgi:hypothetical protein